MIFDRIKKRISSIMRETTENKNIDPDIHHFTAHRGLSGRYPENTVQAFRAASAERFKAIETDIWEVPDFYDRGYDELGFVIMHNEDISGMCGTKAKVPIRELTSAIISNYLITKGKGNREDIDYTIPTLDDFLDIMSENDKELVIEIKDDDISYEGAAKLIRLLKDEDLADRTVLASFHKRSLLTLQGITDEDDGFRFQKFIGARDRGRVDKEIAWADYNDMDIISIKNTLLTKKVFDSIKKRGMQVEVWVVDDRYEAADLIRKGVDRITTNEVLW